MRTVESELYNKSDGNNGTIIITIIAVTIAQYPNKYGLEPMYFIKKRHRI